MFRAARQGILRGVHSDGRPIELRFASTPWVRWEPVRRRKRDPAAPRVDPSTLGAWRERETFAADLERLAAGYRSESARLQVQARDAARAAAECAAWAAQVRSGEAPVDGLQAVAAETGL